MDEEIEEGILLFQCQVFAAQTVQEVVEGADNDVCLMLSRRGEACGQDNPNETDGVLRFDPAVFVDDDGRVCHDC